MKLIATNGRSPVTLGDRVCIMQDDHVFELLVITERPATAAERKAGPKKLQLWLRTP